MCCHHHFNKTRAGFFRGTFILLTGLFLFSFDVHSQNTSLQELIENKDAAFWKAYNACDISNMEMLLTDDLEFYHDKGGIITGRASLSKNLKEGLCKSGKNNLRREVIPGSVAIFPLGDQNKDYGAIISGEHMFYIIEGDKEKLDGQARFTHLWLKKGDDWRMHRIYSYDHGPATYRNSKQSIELTNEKLSEFTGKYLTPSNDPIIIELVKDRLELQAMGKTYILHPENNNSFFTSGQDLTFIFSNDGKLRLTILESNKKVEEAIHQQN